MASGIYIIHNTKNNKVYIGQTYDFKYRWRKHRSSLNNGKHCNKYLQAAWNKYGGDAFDFFILEYCEVDDLNKREQFYLDTYIPKGLCYNIVTDVESPTRGKSPTKETLCKMIESRRNRMPISEETRIRMSNNNKGSGNPMFGKKHSEEKRKQISLSKTGKKRPPITDTARENARIAQLGRVHSEESKIKRSESLKKYWEEKKRIQENE